MHGQERNESLPWQLDVFHRQVHSVPGVFVSPCTNEVTSTLETKHNNGKTLPSSVPQPAALSNA